MPAKKLRLVAVTFAPSTARMEMVLSPSRVTRARLPSGDEHDRARPGIVFPERDLARGASVMPAIVNTETVPSLRFATSASVPRG